MLGFSWPTACSELEVGKLMLFRFTLGTIYHKCYIEQSRVLFLMLCCLATVLNNTIQFGFCRLSNKVTGLGHINRSFGVNPVTISVGLGLGEGQGH